ncbi:MAG: hypothetical protein DPW11_04435 [bacterium]|nr:hypothetical protein [Candidatus Microgenomates bacterium CPR3]MCQ3944991.1 hypothetical protein [bacterium]RIK51245.1 MAG: hypothetical protein DCC61_03105 [Candidatus Microgenomates bacterium]
MSEKIKFQIETLQRAKIIMAVEAVAVNTSVMLGIYLVNRFFDETLITNILIWVGGLFGLAYALYASLGNVKRHAEIRKLEQRLS